MHTTDDYNSGARPRALGIRWLGSVDVQLGYVSSRPRELAPRSTSAHFAELGSINSPRLGQPPA